jgi:hypothetical protein
MSKSIRPGMVALLVVLLVTTLVWILRGLRVLGFMPGSVLWMLIILSIVTAVLSTLR